MSGKRIQQQRLVDNKKVPRWRPRDLEIPRRFSVLFVRSASAKAAAVAGPIRLLRRSTYNRFGVNISTSSRNNSKWRNFIQSLMALLKEYDILVPSNFTQDID